MAGDERVIVHFDCDAFYAQCEEVRDPSLRVLPLGVTQKYLVVTANYPARQRGVAKLMSIKDAQQQCPDLVLINGEDLTPYRKASKRILAVLQRFGVAEKLGMDEVLLDVTEEVEARLSRGSSPPVWCGHVHNTKLGVVQENRHRVMDLRANSASEVNPVETWQASDPPPDFDDPQTIQLMIGSQIAGEARAAMKAETGFRSSAGISCNRMLAKLSSGLHKPDDQTVLRPSEAAQFVAPLPLRAIPGVGYKLGMELKEMGLEKVEDLRKLSIQAMTTRFGERTAKFLGEACYGLDSTPVKPKQPAKAVTVEDSFKSCTTPQAARHVLSILVPDLLTRLQEEFEDEGRRPASLTLKWRHKGNGWSRNSASCPIPATIQVQKGAESSQCETLLKTAVALFTRNVQPPFNITLFNLGASNFAERQASGSMTSALTKFLVAKQEQNKAAPEKALTSTGARAADRLTMKRRDYGSNPTGVPISKTQERFLREGGTLQPSVAEKSRETKLGPLFHVKHTVPEVAGDARSSPVGRPADDVGWCEEAMWQSDGNCLSEPADQEEVANILESRYFEDGDLDLNPSGLNMAISVRQTKTSEPSGNPLPNAANAPSSSSTPGEIASLSNARPMEGRMDGAGPGVELYPQGDRNEGQAVAELQKLRRVLREPQTKMENDSDMALAWKLQAEELRVVNRGPVKSKRKLNTLDSFFAQQ